MGGAVRAQESLVTQLGATADARATIQSLRKRVAELEGAEAQRSQRARDTLLAANRYREAAGRGDFFPTLVRHLAQSVGAEYAFVGELAGRRRDRIRTLAFVAGGEITTDFDYQLAGTPCETVIGEGVRLYEGEVWRRFPRDAWLEAHRIECYLGVPLTDGEGRAAGILAIMQSHRRTDLVDTVTLMRIFALHAAVELERRRTLRVQAQHLRYLEAMHEVTRAIHGSFTRTAEALVETVRVIFAADRAWLMQPCDPRASFWSIPFESRAPGQPPVEGLRESLPVTDSIVAFWRKLVAIDEPVVLRAADPLVELPFPEKGCVQVQAAICIRPKTGEPWVLGLHHCEPNTDWGMFERKLFHDVCARIGDAFSNLLLTNELTHSETLFRAIIEQTGEGIGLASADGRYVLVNRKLCELVGYAEDELLELSVRDLVPPERGLVLFPKVIAGQAARMRGTLKRKDGSVFDAEISGYPIRLRGEEFVLGMVRDVTRAQELEEQLRQSQKMEAVGQLAGGIAHDFNNLLTVVLGHVEFCLSDLSEAALHGGRLQNSMEQVVQAAEKGGALTRQLLAFSRRQIAVPEVIEPNRLLIGMQKMLARLIGEHITMKLMLDPDAGCVLMDPGQLEQVALNIVLNARDSMADGGELVIRSARLRGERGGSPAEVVVLGFEDSGTGIDPAIRGRVFEPFFTTKPPGCGTGLGLATVYGIVTQAGGEVTIDSTLGAGTTLTVTLPHAEGPASVPAAELAALEPVGDATILVCEDDQALRDVVRAALRAQGYSVVVDGAGAEALERVEQGAEPDLLVTDVVMPGMNGWQLARAMRGRFAELGVLYLSGYTPASKEEEEVERSLFLEKPFRIPKLLRFVRDALAARHS